MSDLINSLTPSVTYDGNLTPTGYIEGTLSIIVYAHNYNDLSNKPSINDVTLTGNKTAADLGLLTADDIPVTSVNNMTGDVYLSGSNLRYDANDTINEKIAEVASSIPTIPVTTVNGLTGDVVLDGDNVNYDVSTTLNDKIDDLESQITASGVSSVNGQTGAVTLDGDDIEYSAGVTVNDKIDAVEDAIPEIPVTSVNGETGAVVLDGDDIEYSAGVTVNDQIDTVDGKTTTNATAIGDLSQLTTTDKSSLVGAVNVVNAYKSGDTVTFNFQQLFCRIDASGKRISVFIPLIKKIPSTATVTASGNYSVYFYDGSSLLSNHDIANDTQSIQNTPIGIVLTITLTTALSQTLGYGAVELRNTFTLTFS